MDMYLYTIKDFKPNYSYTNYIILEVLKGKRAVINILLSAQSSGLTPEFVQCGQEQSPGQTV